MNSIKKRFPGAVYRMQDPKFAALIFSSGKVVLTGLKSHEDLKKGLKNLLTRLKEAEITCLDEPQVEVTNMVCSYNLGNTLNLNRIVISFNLENIEYEPEQFPGLVYRIGDPKIVVLIFSSGKIILTGGKNMEDVKKGLAVLKDKLSSIL